VEETVCHSIDEVSSPVPRTDALAFLFRADATSAMGTGHVMRCLALAEGLHDLGHRCYFLLTDVTPALDRRLQGEGITVSRIRTATDDVGAGASCQYAKAIDACGIIVDGYQFDPAWRRHLHNLGKPVLSFYDHLGQSSLGADVIVNAACDTIDPKLQDAPSSALWLVGSPYVLLRRELRQALTTPPLPLVERRSILVTFGGSDPAQLTLPVAEALHVMLPAEVALDVVIGGSVAGVGELTKEVSQLGARVRVHVDPPCMGSLMGAAGLAISAAGTTAGELAALGVPSLITVVADNQLEGAQRAAAKGWCRMLDARLPGAPSRIAKEAQALWLDASARRSMSERSRDDIDGQGVARVCEALLSRAAREN
jgi:UDP-2,4-diacetamido-2,4,6-trideoxy-beta-L-altropyranose hydrolase